MPSPTPPARANARWYQRWILANAVAELVGLGLVAVAGYAVYAIAGPHAIEAAPLAFAALMVGFGAIEGFVVGVAQRSVLLSRLPGLAGWTRASVVGATAAWALGVTPSLLLDAEPAGGAAHGELPLALTLLLAAGLGAVAGPVLAAAQWLSLRKRVGGIAWRWLPANALAWALAMPVVFAAVELAQALGPWLAAPVVALGLLIAGALAGAVHGRWMLRFLARIEASEPLLPVDRTLSS